MTPLASKAHPLYDPLTDALLSRRIHDVLILIGAWLVVLLLAWLVEQTVGAAWRMGEERLEQWRRRSK